MKSAILDPIEMRPSTIRVLVLDPSFCKEQWNVLFNHRGHPHIVHVDSPSFIEDIPASPFYARRLDTLLNTIPYQDLIVFTSGIDINPHLYGESTDPETHSLGKGRDYVESLIYKKAYLNGVPMVGISRGAQFLHVMNGGILKQHDSYHMLHSHPIKLNLGRTMKAESKHHQVMVRTEKSARDWQVLAISEEDQALEVINYPRTQCLCHQPHPEWEREGSPYQSYFLDTVEQLLSIG